MSGTGPAVLAEGLTQDLRLVHRRRSYRPRDRGRRGDGLHRPERRRQIDHHPHALRAASPECRPRLRRRLRRRPQTRGGARAYRLHVAEILALRRSHRARESPLLRRPLQREAGRDGGADALRHHHGRARRARGRAGGHARRRLEAAARPRLRHPPSPARALPRRADLGRRAGGQAALLGPHPRACRRRRHHPRLDPLHGRGRILQSRRPDRPRKARRDRHARASFAATRSAACCSSSRAPRSARHFPSSAPPRA